jgi:L-threonylcarbamoyladenylate synthase
VIVLPVRPDAPDPEVVRETAEVLLRGGIVAFPTDTLYGLSCALMDPSAVEFLHRLKRRPPKLSVISLVAEPDDIDPLVEDIPEVAIDLMARFWPGPLSIIFRASPLVPERVQGEGGTVALRVPKHALSHELLRAVGGPVVSSSANVSGQPPARDAAEVVRAFGNQLDVVLDGGPATSTEPTTLVDVSRGRIEVLRRGILDVSALLGRP